MSTEVITTAHGSGGRNTETLIAELFAPCFHSRSLQDQEDAAVLELEGRIAFTTDSFVITPLIFPGGDIGKLAVCGTVNDLAAMGAVPKYLSAGFILEEGLDFDVLRQIVRSMADAAAEAGIELVAADTKVVEGHGGMFVNTSGIGVIPPKRSVRVRNIRPGDVLLLSGTLGDHHATVLSARMEIENQIRSDCAPLNDMTESLFISGLDVRAMRDVTRGGLGTVLNEFAHSSGFGIRIREEALPVSPEVRSLCDILGLDPLYMANEGKMLIVVAPEDESRALTILKDHPCGRGACWIGTVDSAPGVLMETPIGGLRRVDALVGEGLPRIC